MSFIFAQKSFQFPMDWGWGNGFKIRKDIWSRIAVKLRVRRIPVCWKHLEFWETFDSFMFFCVECCMMFGVVGAGECPGSTCKRGFRIE